MPSWPRPWPSPAQTARQRGWAVVASGPTSVTFEQPLDPDTDGSVSLLRITATGAESPGGVTVSLAAQEVRPASGTAQDVTQRYRDNLLNALDSLATKWGLRPARPDASMPRRDIGAPAPSRGRRRRNHPAPIWRRLRSPYTAHASRYAHRPP